MNSRAVQLAGEFKTAIGAVLAFLGGMLAAHRLVFRNAVPAMRFLSRSLFRESRWPRAAAVIELLFMWRALGFQLKPSHIGRAARLRVEFEILKGLDRAQWRKETKTLTDELVDIIKRYTESDNNRAEPYAVSIESCSPLTDANETLESYFKELGCLGIDKKERRFLLHVEVGRSYLTAHYFLYALLGNYNEDWTPVLEKYGEAVLATQKRNYPAIAKEVFEIQAYQFNCWLLWGPSVAICTCHRWRSKLQMLQLGHGDECNSVCLAVDEVSIYDDMLRILAAPARDVQAHGVERLAMHVDKASGTLRWSKALEPCKAMEDMDKIAGRPVLELADLKGLKSSAHGGDGLSYYSAYMWVMFVLFVVDDRGRWTEVTPIDHGSPNGWQEGWRNLLPFFEHGNIADASTMNYLSTVLLAKTVKAIESLLALEPKLHLRYACAFDDPMCEGARVPRRADQAMRGRLRAAFAHEPRIVIPDPAPEHSPYHAYCSCALPTLASNYIKHVKPDILDDEEETAQEA